MTAHRFQQTIDELKSNLRDIEAERVALDAQEETILSTIEGLERLIALESGAAVRTTKEPKQKAAKAVDAPHRKKTGRPKADQSKIEAGIALVSKGATIGKAASVVGVSRNTLGSAIPPIRAKNLLVEKEDQGRKASKNLSDYKKQVRQGPVENPSDCGKCVTRIIDGKSLLAASPDCPTHGLGLGTAQEGRDRKGDPMYVKGTTS